MYFRHQKWGTKWGNQIEKMPPRYLRGILRWRWADSNRRPNNAPGSFLHAYPAFGFRPEAAGKRATTGLSSTA